jgi:hypothetical protein
MEEPVRWSIKVSKDTDLTLRTFLGAQGMKKGDLSKFIEDALRRRVLQCTIQEIRARNADAEPDEIQRIVDEAVGEVRAERRAKRRPTRPDARGARYQHHRVRPNRPGRQARSHL